MNLIDVIQRPLVTEKAVALRETANQYVFAVDPRASKTDVRAAVEKFFRVRVTAVHTATCHARPSRSLRGGRRSAQLVKWKKAIVTLSTGQKIELFEGA